MSPLDLMTGFDVTSRVVRASLQPPMSDIVQEDLAFTVA